MACRGQWVWRRAGTSRAPLLTWAECLSTVLLSDGATDAALGLDGAASTHIAGGCVYIGRGDRRVVQLRLCFPKRQLIEAVTASRRDSAGHRGLVGVYTLTGRGSDQDQNHAEINHDGIDTQEQSSLNQFLPSMICFSESLARKACRSCRHAVHTPFPRFQEQIPPCSGTV